VGYALICMLARMPGTALYRKEGPQGDLGMSGARVGSALGSPRKKCTRRRSPREDPAGIYGERKSTAALSAHLESTPRIRFDEEQHDDCGHDGSGVFRAKVDAKQRQAALRGAARPDPSFVDRCLQQSVPIERAGQLPLTAAHIAPMHAGVPHADAMAAQPLTQRRESIAIANRLLRGSETRQSRWNSMLAHLM
jgi:hypothetical protein